MKMITETHQAFGHTPHADQWSHPSTLWLPRQTTYKTSNSPSIEIDLTVE